MVCNDWLFRRYALTFEDTGQLMSTSDASHYTSFAVVINTYKRPQQLADAVRHYAETCGVASGVNQVNIIWAEEDVTPPAPDSFFSNPEIRKKTRSTIHVIPVANSLNSRFLPLPSEYLKTTSPAIFMVDDDIRVDCFSLRQSFEAWKRSPDSMVGFYPRLSAEPRRSSADALVYHSWPMVYFRQQMNFVLTKACFLNHRYMEMYSSPNHPQEIKDYVDKYFNCEDVAMAMLVANVTRAERQVPSSTPQQESITPSLPARAIYVEANVIDKGLFNGISTGTGHMARRSECLSDLTKIYQNHGWGVPFRESFDLRESSWIHHKPDFWWQMRPSNFFEWGALSNILY